MIKVLFICHGNICRSVSAQYIMQQLVDEANLGYRFEIESAATSREEIGNRIYPPMERTLRAHNVGIGDHRARQLTRADYDEYDLIIGMDDENRYYMNRILGEDPENKIHMLMEYTDTPHALIEDPWYSRNFEKAYSDILEGCTMLLQELK